MVALGFLAGLWVSAKLARQSGLDSDKVVNLGVYTALAGLLGAKLLMFAFNPQDFFSLATLQAGGIFYGGLIGALLAGVWIVHRWKLPPGQTLDCLAPGLALGQAIGRLGCFAAGCCWGEACDRSWAVTFMDPRAHELVGVPIGTPVHPTQLYEAALGILIFLFLWRFVWQRPSRRPGIVLGWYLVLSATARFAVEFFRAHEQANPFGGPLSTAQWISIGLFALGGWLLIPRRQTP
jgi:phosphatidylglycerol:prolipoprotein diacylglycerol transferase